MLFFNSLPCKLDKSISLTGSAIFLVPTRVDINCRPQEWNSWKPRRYVVYWWPGWWFQTFLFSISYMGYHPSQWRTHIFQMVFLSPPPTSDCFTLYISGFSTRKILRFNFCPCPSHSRQLRWSTKGKERCSRHILLRLSWKGNLQQRWYIMIHHDTSLLAVSFLPFVSICVVFFDVEKV